MVVPGLWPEQADNVIIVMLGLFIVVWNFRKVVYVTYH